MPTDPFFINTQHFFRNYLARNDTNFEVVNAVLNGIGGLIGKDQMAAVAPTACAKAFDFDAVFPLNSLIATQILYRDADEYLTNCISNESPITLGENPLRLTGLPPHLQSNLYLRPGRMPSSAFLSLHDSSELKIPPAGLMTWRQAYPNSKYVRITIFDFMQNQVHITSLYGIYSMFADLMSEFSLMFPVEAWYCRDKRISFIGSAVDRN
jgi:hypothetical protein